MASRLTLTLTSTPLPAFLAERLQIARNACVWPNGVLEQVHASLVFSSPVLTLLCAEHPPGTAHSAAAEDMSTVAERHHGVLEGYSPAAVLASFTQPVAALEMAIELQRAARTPYQIALLSGPCLAASFSIDGRRMQVLVGRQVMRAELLARSVAPGAVLVSPETFPLLEAHFAISLCDGLLATEFVDERLMEATLTLPPGEFAEVSTFAGLGMTH